MDSPELWRWIWLIGVVAFMGVEVSIAGSFFLLPFAIGAFVAFLLALVGVPLPYELGAFLAASVASFVALRPLARRLDQIDSGAGVGAKRLVGADAVVTRAIPAKAGHGQIRVGGESWRAESLDDQPIPEGAAVSIVEIRGTRAVVWTRGIGIDADPEAEAGPELS